MKAALSIAILGIVLTAIAGCGGYNSNSSSSSAPVTGIKKRAVVSNTQGSVLDIIDAQHDECINQHQQVPCSAAATIFVGANPGPLTVSQDLTTTLAFNRGSNTIAVINNAKEQQTATIALPDTTDMVLVSGDNKTAWAPVRNASVTAGQPLGALAVANVTAATETNVAIPAAKRAFLAHNGKKILVLPDTTADPSLTNTVWIFDTTANTAVQATCGAGTCFDHPAYAVFSSDDSKAYILNCGPECGGAAAGVSVLDMGTSAAGAIAPVTGGATVGLLNSSTLFVAGNAGGTGTVTVVNVSGAPAAGSTASISDGYHNKMVLAGSKLLIGTITCTNTAKSCLTIYDTTANTAKDVFNTAQPNQGDVTGIQPISDRTVVYVIEGGELKIYDTSTDSLAATQLDIVGAAFDVKQIDP